MKYLTFLFFVALIFSFKLKTTDFFNEKTIINYPTNEKKLEKLWNDINCAKDISLETFREALNKKKLFGLHNNKLVIIDFSKPSTQKRFYVLNLETRKMIYKTYVAHGKNSGTLYAKHFSNEEASLKSSLGFYKTAETYYGKHGYSLRLDGLEKGINSNARKRAIVVHGADYVSEAFITKYGRLGRSYGCPALAKEESKEIIGYIKNGTGIYIHNKN